MAESPNKVISKLLGVMWAERWTEERNRMLTKSWKGMLHLSFGMTTASATIH